MNKRTFYRILILIVSLELKRDFFSPPFYTKGRKNMLLIIFLAHLE